MKKSLLALAVLGAFAGVASAQSSVTLIGVLDVNARYVSNDGKTVYSLSTDGINSSRLGFRGVEDLGGGLKAGFVLLSGVSADTGKDSGETAGKTFNRRSTVSLMGNFGEVRLGRDYTPTFWNFTIFDAFGTNGIGDSSHVLAPVLVQSTFVRADNSIGYFLPAGIGGVYGQAMMAAAEGVDSGRYEGGRLGYAAGPFDIAGSYAQTGITGTTNKAKSWSIGGSFDFGVAKLLGYYAQVEATSLPQPNKQTVYSISGVVPLGQGEIHVGYDVGKLNNNTSGKADQFAIGYVYNLSKRTALYTTLAELRNRGGLQNSITSGTAQTAVPTVNGNSKGAEFGIRHFF